MKVENTPIYLIILLLCVVLYGIVLPFIYQRPDNTPVSVVIPDKTLGIWVVRSKESKVFYCFFDSSSNRPDYLDCSLATKLGSKTNPK